LRYRVEVIFQHNVPIQRQPVVVLQVGPGIDQYLYGLVASEYRKPFDDGAGQEMRTIGFGKSIAAACHEWVPSYLAQSA
jgi:hypothetical protein